MLNMEPDTGLNSTTLESRSEWKSKTGCSTSGAPPGALEIEFRWELRLSALSWTQLPWLLLSLDSQLTLSRTGEYRGCCLPFLTCDFSRRSGDKSSPPSLAPLALDPPDLSEEKESVQADPALQGDLRRLTLEGEEENGEVQRMCEEKSLSEASEDPSVRGLNPDPTDSKTLQGIALGVEGPTSCQFRKRALLCF